MPILGIVDVLCLRPEDRDLLCMELEGKVIRYLSARREDDPTWSLEVEDV